MSFSKKLKQKLQILIVKIFIHILAILPLSVCHFIGNIIGHLVYYIPNSSRRITEINIKLCFPDMTPAQQNKLIKQSLIETGKTLTEASPMWKWKKEKLFQLIKKLFYVQAFRLILPRKLD